MRKLKPSGQRLCDEGCLVIATLSFALSMKGYWNHYVGCEQFRLVLD
jgi:hypothetical protein